MVRFLRGQWQELTRMVDPFSIVFMEGLLIVPVVMAALFYPLEVLAFVLVTLVISTAVFETVLYVRHHPRHARRRESRFTLPL